MAANINGLIYYKLDSDVHGYPGDITKNCGLRGEEIDGNFNFLRGHDIKSFSFDENGTLFLTRYNGDIISAKQSEKPDYNFSYSPETGELTIVTPDGKEMVISGFKVKTNVYHDCTLEGFGTQEIPLEVSNIAKTGRYKPAIRLIDTTIKNKYIVASTYDDEGNVIAPEDANEKNTLYVDSIPSIKNEEYKYLFCDKLYYVWVKENESGIVINFLPEENNTKHDRYVTKEKISRFGRLYPLSGVKEISERLEKISSEWHIPSKDEWDEILNEIDCAKPNHTDVESNAELGEFAGSTLKSTKFWEKINNDKVLSEDAYGFTIYPVGYCGNRGKDYYGSFGLSSAFWTSTVEDNFKDMYVKKFEYNKETVGQHTWGENYYLSLRLVKKFTGNNFNESEFIDGMTVNCVHIPGTSTIWTKENIAFSNTQYDGFYPEKWDEYKNVEEDENSYEIRYFVNDWNGSGWDKHEIKEGEGIVLYEGDNGRMHEWLLVNGELIDTAVLLKSEFKKEIEHIHNRIDQEIKDRDAVDQQLWEAIANESKLREEVDNQQWAHIEKEASLREDADKEIWNALNKESDDRQEVDKQLWAHIEKEASLREDADKELWEGIAKEAEARDAVDQQIWANLNDEAKLREEGDSQLWAHIEKEASLREDADKELWGGIAKESEERQKADKELWDGIAKEAEAREEVDKQLWGAISNESQIREEIDNQQWAVINNEIAERKEADADLQRQIDENKVTPENNSVIIVPGKTENGTTTPTTIKVNLDDECEHLKLGDNGIYFDGYFGQF